MLCTPSKYGIYYTQTLWSTASFLQWSLIGVNIAGRTKRSVTSAAIFISYAAGELSMHLEVHVLIICVLTDSAISATGMPQCGTQ